MAVKDQAHNTIFEQVIPLLKLEGNQEDVQELTGLIRMIASVPTGQKLLTRGVLSGEKPSTISLVSEIDGDYTHRGAFAPSTKSIKILRLPKIIKYREVDMAATLAHELTHCLHFPKMVELYRYTSNIDEVVLAHLLDEIDARVIEEQITRELYDHHDLKRMCIVNGKKILKPIQVSSEERKEVVKQGLSGNISYLKNYQKDKRKLMATMRPPAYDFNRSCAFRIKVDEFLKDMQVNMSFDEAMMHLRSSLKLLPSPKRLVDNQGR